MPEPTPTVTADDVDTVTSADGTPIAFFRSGDGPPLVLVYGTGDVHQFWDVGAVRSTLAERCTVYAVERRGRGESGDVQQTASAEPTRTGGSGDATEYELEREAEDVAAVVDAIDEPATLLGHSAGALYSLAAARRTDNLRGLVLYEPPIAVGDHELDVEAGVVAVEGLLADGENERALALFLRGIGQLTPDELDELRSAPIWPAMVEAAPTLPREVRAIGRYAFDAASVADLETPTLLLTGSESPPFYGDPIVTLDDALPNSRIATFEGAQHMAMHTAPDRFVETVLSFVEESN